MFKSKKRYHDSKRSGKKLGILLLIILVGAVIYGLLKWNIRGTLPQMTVTWAEKVLDLQQSITLGAQPSFNLKVTNKRGGLCQIVAKIVQQDKEALLIEHNHSSAPEKNQTVNLQVENKKLTQFGFEEGSVQLMAEASNCAFFKRTEKMVFNGTVDLSPPRVAVTSTQHYINQGGADVLTYTTSPDTVWSGVRVGPYEFKGFKKSNSTEEHFAFFVYSYDLPTDTKILVIARDLAGNESIATVKPARFFPKIFRERTLTVDDRFIETKVADIIANTPEIQNTGENLKNYLLVNRDLRKKNAAFLAELSKKSAETFYWKDAFKPLTNAAVEANFADYRSYVYQDQKVDEQVHLGFDLAVTEQYPITASNRGKVVFADYLGIYGNTVILDHGYGLQTLYGHLSSIDVKEGDWAEKDQKVGNSGATGLAGGDHLHFSMLIQGVQTNPIEFWDQHWIEDHVYLRVDKNQFGQDLQKITGK